MRKNKTLAQSLTFLALLLVSLYLPIFYTHADVSLSSSATAEDIPDRLYFQKLRQMIGLATKTIDVAVSDIEADGLLSDPVIVLMNDLVTAQKRGVKVRLFFNTFSESSLNASFFLHEDTLYHMRREGVEVHFVSPSYRVYDRLVVIDGEWVFEGGLPWTREALARGLGSITLIQSKEIALKKKIRLELLPLWDVEQRKQERTEGRTPIPAFLLRELKFFPSMIQSEDSDAMKVYLALLRRHHELKLNEFSISLEELTHEIPSERYYETSAVVVEVNKALERLETSYELIHIKKKDPAHFVLEMQLTGNLLTVVGVPDSFFLENYAKELSAHSLYVYFVILSKSQLSGESPVWLGSAHNVEQDFPISPEKFKLGIDELRRNNLIEVFPFQLNQEKSAQVEYRYLINPILSLSQKLDNWKRMRDEYGDDNFKMARDLAAAFGEPEDAKVVNVYLELLKRYAQEDVLAMTQRVATLPPDSTPSLLNYIKQVLDYETKPYELATTGSQQSIP